MNIKTVVDHVRGCGNRKPGGLYLVSSGLAAPCGRLPIPLDRCPCCDAGIKPSRGWTWIRPGLLLMNKICEDVNLCERCPLGEVMPERAGLLWVGEKFYPTPGDFTEEAARLGISRRLSQIPRDFKLGETWVFFAHRKTILQPDATHTPGIFHAFRPTAIEYVVRGDEKGEELQALVDRGITPVRVKLAEQQSELLDEEPELAEV